MLTNNSEKNHPSNLTITQETTTIRPPVVTKQQLLPYGELSWENFERLCLSLANCDGEPERCQQYGEPGQTQDGIDILVRVRADHYHVWQVKRHQSFSASKIKAAVDKFLEGKWHPKADRFVLTVQASLRNTSIADEIEHQTDRLRELGIEFIPLGGEELSGILKDKPGIVNEFFGPTWAEEFCGVAIDRRQTQETSGIIGAYTSWMIETMRHYWIPGINSALPIAQCWLPLGAIETHAEAPSAQTAQEALNLYLRAGQGNSYSGHGYDAEWLGVGLPRVVLLGGPGSGKSLLLRRIAHRETETGRTVLLARLRFVAQGVYKHGKSFEDSLLSVAADGISFDDSQKRIVSQNASLLLLDGLDECGEYRHTIAEAIVKWSVSHPNITIIVTSRIVGHNAGALPQWPHFVLHTKDYPFNLSEFIEGVCREAFKNQKTSIEQAMNRLGPVINANGWDGKDKEYKAVSSVPLLYGFMVSLAINGNAIPKKRNELFKAVIDLLARTEVQNRGADTNIDYTVAFEGLHAFGWLLMENPTLDFHDLLDKAGQLLANEFGERAASARRLAEQAFRFWEERRLVERLHHGTQELATFVHLGFCEYAAARYIINQNPDFLHKWVQETSRDPRWREVYLNAGMLGMGNCLIELLLEFDAPTAIASEGVLLAASLSTSSAGVGEELLERIVRELFLRMTSGFRDIICKAGAAALLIARQTPQLVGRAAKPLLLHPDEWTRYAALALCLESGNDYVDLDEGWRCLRSTIILRATAMLVQNGMTPDLTDKIRIMLENGDCSVSDSIKLSELLIDSGIPELIDSANNYNAKSLELWSKQITDEDEIKFLDMILQACCLAHDDIVPGRPPFIQLAKFVHVLRIGEMPIGTWWTWQASGMKAEAILAIRGAMLAAEVESAGLAKDILGVKQKLKDTTGSFYSLMPNFPIRGNWAKSKEITECDPAILASAVNHPCEAVAITAAEMILAGTGGDTAVQALKDVLQTRGRSSFLLIIAKIGTELWGNATLDLFLSMLDKKLTAGCEHLLAELPTLSGERMDERVTPIIRKALYADFPAVTQKAVELYIRCGLPGSLVPDLRLALAHWKEHEKPYPTGGGVIPESPRSIIVQAITQSNGLSVDELLSLYLDVRSDVRGAAEDALLQMAQHDSEVLSLLLDYVIVGKIWSATLSKITKLPPESLKYEHDRLLGFLKSENPDLRIVMVQALQQLNLWTKDERFNFVQSLLDDPDVDVRNMAQISLTVIGKK